VTDSTGPSVLWPGDAAAAAAGLRRRQHYAQRCFPALSIDHHRRITMPLRLERLRSSFRSGALLAAVVIGTTGCGGGGNTANTPPGGNPGTTSGWTAGLFQPASNFAARCADPRTGIDPETLRPYPDRAGTTVDENNWLRSWSNDLYLWYREIVDRDPALYSTPDYFNLLKTTALTPSGRPKDNFHFSLPTSDWQARSQSGVAAGYGAEWAVLAGRPPRDIRVAYTEPGSPAADAADLRRGTRILAIDGVDVVNDNTSAGVDTIVAALYPSGTGRTHVFTVRDPGAETTRQVTLTSTAVTSAPVQNVGSIDTGSGVVGYLLFNEHIATAEAALVNAVNVLGGIGIDDLVIDLRYNGGGFLAIASQLAYMIAGPGRTSGRTFERMVFNDKHPTRNPVTGQTLSPLPFADQTLGFSLSPGQPLPDLSLDRVFILTGQGTCSASETIVNALRGIGFPVILIGDTTCGKPYGFYPTDNCGTTYFTVQFKGVNEQGFGEYPDGFSPANTVDPAGVPVPGCAVADDFDNELGAAAEARVAAALGYRANGTCPAPAAASGDFASSVRGLGLPPPIDYEVSRPIWRESRVLEGTLQ
jgi:carboxyl-terminal processing protease